MIELSSKYGNIKVFSNTGEESAFSQILSIGNSPLGKNANIRIMSDFHSGKGCVIGTTMKVSDKICPNVLGVDLSCGVMMVELSKNIKDFEALDNFINKKIPHGMSCYERITPERKKEMNYLTDLKCWDKLKDKTQNTAIHSCGTLGGGNHYIELNISDNGKHYLTVHSGSRNIGKSIAEYYQRLAEKNNKDTHSKEFSEKLKNTTKSDRQSFIENYNDNTKISMELSYLTGSDMNDYLYDVKIMRKFAYENRY